MVNSVAPSPHRIRKQLVGERTSTQQARYPTIRSALGTKKAPDCWCNQGLKVPATCYSPTGEPRSTLADEALHFRVRNGNGCCILSMATGKTIERIWLDAP